MRATITLCPLKSAELSVRPCQPTAVRAHYQFAVFLTVIRKTIARQSPNALRLQTSRLKISLLAHLQGHSDLQNSKYSENVVWRVFHYASKHLVFVNSLCTTTQQLAISAGHMTLCLVHPEYNLLCFFFFNPQIVMKETFFSLTACCLRFTAETNEYCGNEPQTLQSKCWWSCFCPRWGAFYFPNGQKQNLYVSSIEFVSLDRLLWQQGAHSNADVLSGWDLPSHYEMSAAHSRQTRLFLSSIPTCFGSVLKKY